MSIITGQFSYQITDLDIKTATFYLGKNDGIIYLQDFDPIHPSEKDNIYWNTSEYCLKLVNDPDENDINTIPIYPLPTTFDKLKPSYENISDTITQKVWMYHSEFAIENTVEYIKFYITEEEAPADPPITSTYILYTVDSNNDLVPYTYIPPMIQKKNIKISIKKSDGTSNIYTGTWYSMTETFDVIQFKHKDGYDYKYKLKLGIYQGILNNIDKIKNTISTPWDLLLDIVNLLIITDPVTNTFYQIIKDYYQQNISSPFIGTELNTIDQTLIDLLTPLLTEINQIITDSIILFRPTDLPTLTDPTDTGISSYIVIPSNCADIVDSENTTLEIKYIPLNLEILENNFIAGTTTYVDLITFYTNSLVEINKYRVILGIFLNQQLDFRRSYVNILNHYQIFTINNYKADISNWFKNCDTSCLDKSMTISLKRLKYNSNINIIDGMLENIRYIYHIGKLQELLIDNLTVSIQKYIELTNLIDLSDPDNDEYVLAFQLYIPLLIDEVDKISNFIVYNGSHIFSDPINPKELTYRFISSSTNSVASNNDLIFQLPTLSSTVLHLDDLNPDPNTVDNLYSNVPTNQTTILSIYTSAINLAKSKKSTFNSLKLIIDLRLKTIIDFIEYTKNLIDE